MTRQRLKESSIKWEVNLSLESFALKVIKKIEMLAFSNKTKIIEAEVPEKIKNFLDEQFTKELDFFQKKYKFKIIIKSDKNIIIPEYKITLLNKNKKVIDVVESFIKINGKKPEKKISKPKTKDKEKDVSLGKILWTRRKSRKLN